MATPRRRAKLPPKQTAVVERDDEYVRVRVNEIRALGRQTVDNVIRIGQLLTEVKARVGHGNWSAWLKERFEWGETTAHEFMRVHELAKAKSANFANLGLPVSALYLLARKSTPPAAVKEIVEQAKAKPKGQKISHKEVKATVAKHKPPKKTKPKADFSVIDISTGKALTVQTTPTLAQLEAMSRKGPPPAPERPPIDINITTGNKTESSLGDAWIALQSAIEQVLSLGADPDAVMIFVRERVKPPVAAE